MQDEKALTPNELASRYGISIHKVLGWIKTGELGAVNVAQDERKRPQWVMLPKHLEAFEAARGRSLHGSGPGPAASGRAIALRRGQ